MDALNDACLTNCRSVAMNDQEMQPLSPHKDDKGNT